MKVTVLHKSKPKEAEELIDLSCRTRLAWISNNFHDVKYLISEVCKRNLLSYNLQLGSMCAHVAKHYSSDRMRYKYSDLIAAEKVIHRFHLVFQGDCQKGGGFSRVEELANYGRMCLILTMKSDFRDSIPDVSDFNERLHCIVYRLLSSMLFEFIPSSYSDLLLKLYLEDAQTQEERDWIEENKNRYKDVYPYHDFFQIISSLSYHILNTRKAIDCEHYLQILSNPSAGCVEWPMVLGVRNLHKLPPIGY